jgi:hypothetical protein
MRRRSIFRPYKATEWLKPGWIVHTRRPGPALEFRSSASIGAATPWRRIYDRAEGYARVRKIGSPSLFA